MTDEDTDIVEALADMTAALPQACAQLSKILEQALSDQLLTMDSMVEETDPAIVVGVAQHHLEEAREVAVDLHKLLAAAHNATAHISSHGKP